MKWVKKLSLFIFSFGFTLLALGLQHSAVYAKTSGAKFLEVTPSARASGMGGALCAFCDDLGAISINPAGLSLLGEKEVFFSYNMGFQGIRYGFISGLIRCRGLPLHLAVSYNYFTTPREEITDLIGDGTGVYFQYIGGAAALTASWMFGRLLYVGLSGKWIHEEIAEDLQATFAIDGGMILFLRMVRFGLSCENIGWRIGVAKLPEILRVGLGFEAGRFRLCGQYRIRLVEEEGSFDFGVEYGMMEVAALRCGYRQVDGYGGLSIGLGVKLKDLRLDYSWVPHEALGSNHRVSLGISLHGIH